MDKTEKKITKEEIKSLVSSKLRRHYAKTVENATKSQLYKALSLTVRDQIMEKWARSKENLEKENIIRLPTRESKLSMKQKRSGIPTVLL